jgi:large subunit ribosomal protein L17
VKSLITHGQIRTTHARAKAAQRVADRLVTWGKDGSIHARRQAYRILQDRFLVKQLFAEVAPRFMDAPGGYTRVMRLGIRRGDGAQTSLLAFSRLPVATPEPAPAKGPRTPEPQAPKAEKPAKEGKPKASPGLLENLRNLWGKSKKGSASS